MWIYTIENKLNGKLYVGQTIQKNPAHRWSGHTSPRRGKGRSAIKSAILKLGSENFEFSIIDTAPTQDELDGKEIYWIYHLSSMSPNGYNMTDGGSGGRKLSPEAVARMAASKKGVKLGPPSDETRAKISQGLRKFHGPKKPRKSRVSGLSKEEIIAKRRAGQRAFWTKEARQAYGEMKRSLHIKQSPEQVEKRASQRRGAKFSHEQKINLARAHMNGKIIACSNGKTYLSVYEAVCDTGLRRTGITACCIGEKKTTRGVKFWYLEKEV